MVTTLQHRLGTVGAGGGGDPLKGQEIVGVGVRATEEGQGDQGLPRSASEVEPTGNEIQGRTRR